MEKYGEIPKRFTKEWWEHFWEYYKLHTIVTIVIATMIIITAVQCSRQVNSDCTITFAGDAVLTDEAKATIADRLAGQILDSDGNGEITPYIQEISFSNDDIVNAEYLASAIGKLILDFSTGEGMIYIFDSTAFDYFLETEDGLAMLSPVDEWLNDEALQENIVTKDNVACAVKLTDSKLLSELGIDGDDLYLTMRAPREDEKADEKSEKIYKSSIIALKTLVGR